MQGLPQVCKFQRGAVAGGMVCPCAIWVLPGFFISFCRTIISGHWQGMNGVVLQLGFLAWQKVQVISLSRSVGWTCKETAGELWVNFCTSLRPTLRGGWSRGVCSPGLWPRACQRHWGWSLTGLSLGSHQGVSPQGLVCNTVVAFTNPQDLTPSENTQNKHHEIFTAFCTARLSHLKACQNPDIAESPESALHLPYLQSLQLKYISKSYCFLYSLSFHILLVCLALLLLVLKPL